MTENTVDRQKQLSCLKQLKLYTLVKKSFWAHFGNTYAKIRMIQRFYERVTQIHEVFHILKFEKDLKKVFHSTVLYSKLSSWNVELFLCLSSSLSPYCLEILCNLTPQPSIYTLHQDSSLSVTWKGNSCPSVWDACLALVSGIYTLPLIYSWSVNT